jgi:hypothetical protein
MGRPELIGVVVLMLIAEGRACAEPPCCEQCAPSFLQRFAPAGGWWPCGGLLHWWNPNCFPHCGGPNDYCRKKLPRLCWPPYPSYYIWGPPENGLPQGTCRRASNEAN